MPPAFQSQQCVAEGPHQGPLLTATEADFGHLNKGVYQKDTK